MNKETPNQSANRRCTFRCGTCKYFSLRIVTPMNAMQGTCDRNNANVNVYVFDSCDAWERQPVQVG